MCGARCLGEHLLRLVAAAATAHAALPSAGPRTAWLLTSEGGSSRVPVAGCRESLHLNCGALSANFTPTRSGAGDQEWLRGTRPQDAGPAAAAPADADVAPSMPPLL